MNWSSFPNTGSVPLAVPPSMLELRQRRRGSTTHRHKPCVDLGLHNAVARGDIGSISYALLGGQRIDSVERGLQAIHVAAAQPDAMVVEFLLQNGANVDAKTTVHTRHHQTPSAAQSAAVAPELRSRGSISLIRELGTSAISSPLSFTSGLNAMQGAPQGLQPVPPGVEAAMDTWYCGATPLHFAAANGRELVVGVLVSHGADLEIRDSYGHTAEELAEARGDSDVVRMLQLERKRRQTLLLTSFPAAHDPPNTTIYAFPSPDSCTAEHSCEPRLEPPIVAIPTPEFPPARRHTSGSADNNCASVAYSPASADDCMPFAYSPASPTARLMKHRNTSPIGVRPLSITNSMYYAEQQAMRARPQSADAQVEPKPVVHHPVRRRPAQIQRVRQELPVSRSSSCNSRRERSYTDSVIESAWHSFLRKAEETESESEQNVQHIVDGIHECDEDAPLAELWMWKQAAMAVRNRRSHSLNATTTTVPRSSSDEYVVNGRSAFVRPSLSNLRFEQL